ncbi:lipopolysaccharide biosynthesis protein [Mucilaginibacter sp. BT774]|uniref:lipopolysaccharide biosynthesis protein n=1 Tax=Mucilaginibacter sp. BT774 TaxID=3062276 RepID=UPI0026765A60|nr:oligosaccharide flippase family protein [Mucilaginibacter sp. BT774]MDO3628845.1 oligosaccharide flippase family protein [Mucilaginibacter sp. BT774]
MRTVVLKLKSFFTQGHERTLKAKKNVAISFLLKGISIFIGFVLIPMTINYVNPTQYGIWLTLSSVMSWFSFFDIGLGNGLKNKVAQANALKDYSQARIYISTTYAILAIISASVFMLFFGLNHFISWPRILNTSDVNGGNLNHLALIVFGLFCIQFVAQIVNVILTALHEPARVSLMYVVGQICVIIVIYILTKNTRGELNYLVFVLGGMPVFVQLLTSIIYFNTTYKHVSPSIKLINFKYSRELLSLGGVFFIIQMGALLLFETDNILITQLFGPRSVTTFNVAYKLFSMVIMIFNIIITPFWSAFTDAATKGDMAWIRRVLTKMEKYWLLLCAFTLVILFASPLIYKFWLKGSVSVPFSVSVAMAFYVMGYSWIMLQCFFLNGIGKIRMQVYLYAICTLINIPTGILLGKYMGIPGVTYSNVIIFVFMGIVLFIQSKKILNSEAKGIWNK